MRSLRRLISEARLLLEGYDGDGVMLALFPDEQTAHHAATLGARFGGDRLEADDIHVTLAFLGDYQDLMTRQMNSTFGVARSLAHRHGVIEGRLAGLGRFSGSEKGVDVIYASPDLPELPDLRRDAIEMLEHNGIGYSRKHGYTPHMTLTRLPADERVELPFVEPVAIRFSHVGLGIAGSRIKYAL